VRQGVSADRPRPDARCACDRRRRLDVGFGIGLAFAALTNLVVRAVDDRRTSVFVATTAVSRSTGAALGAQVAAAIVIAAGVVAAGFPAEHGFTGAFVLGLISSVVALVATTAIPAHRRDRT
jgi:hypothetical protein